MSLLLTFVSLAALLVISHGPRVELKFIGFNPILPELNTPQRKFNFRVKPFLTLTNIYTCMNMANRRNRSGRKRKAPKDWAKDHPDESEALA